MDSEEDLKMTSSTKKRRIQKYRCDWENFPEFKNWLIPIPDNKLKAGCTLCDKIMVSDLRLLRKHSLTRTHMKKQKERRVKNLMKRSGAKGSEDDENVESNLNPDESDEDQECATSQYSDHIWQPGIGDEKTTWKSGKNLKSLKKILKSSCTPCTAMVSKEAPFWKADAVVDGEIIELKSTDYLGRYLIMIFYPQDFSKLCPNEINRISEKIDLFHRLGTEVLACSVDSCYAHQAWARIRHEDGGVAHLKLSLVSDPTHSISERFGCYEPQKGYALRATYIIDKKGILRHITMNDLPVARSIDEIIRLLKAFQHTDDKKQYCPVEWVPGKPTIDCTS